jgi:hypothetical protein
MSRHAVNLIDASLKKPPPVAEFVEVLEHWMDQEEESSSEDPLHGVRFGAVARPTGSVKSERAGVQSFLLFVVLCCKMNATYKTLDHRSIAWASWVIAPQDLRKADEG